MLLLLFLVSDIYLSRLRLLSLGPIAGRLSFWELGWHGCVHVACSHAAHSHFTVFEQALFDMVKQIIGIHECLFMLFLTVLWYD